MENTYLDRLLEELLIEIFLYLDIEDIKKSDHIITKSKMFWVKKLINDGLEEYIPFLGIYQKISNYSHPVNYVEDYIIIKRMKSNCVEVDNIPSLISFSYFTKKDEVIKKIFDPKSDLIDTVIFVTLNIDKHRRKSNTVTISKRPNRYILDYGDGIRLLNMKKYLHLSKIITFAGMYEF